MTAVKKNFGFSDDSTPAFSAGLQTTSNLRELQFENQRLSRQLKSFIAKARQNEEKLRRFQQLELQLIECGSLHQLLQLVLNDYRHTSKLEQVSIKLHDPEYELRRIIETEHAELLTHPGLIFTEEQRDLTAIYRHNFLPLLGPYRRDLHEGLFVPSSMTLRSVAMLPMIRNGQIIGSLQLGSSSEERFTSGSGTDFLQRLANIVAVCLHNVATAERLKQVGLTDVLTGVNNRRFFDQRLQEESSAASRKKHPLCVLFFDVDHFKQINDSYGHHAGDIVLKEVANIIRTQLRTSDVLGRYGGEEFSALLVDTPLEKAVEIAERVRKAIASTRYAIKSQQSLHVTISIGIAATQCNENSPMTADKIAAQLLAQADACLYDAKHQGRNRVICRQFAQAAADVME
ncbi:MAG: sensor domain-containing diguanylate cyclase [Gammaproteobacteria bacterium]|nr:sensor domain-containing diguanylate cyclase [Gammaproteobacteria bacterium]